jgi:GH24 family phage-related lysozyme (muramidase)
MKLIDNWPDVVKRAHSMWAFYLSVLLLVAPDVTYWAFGIDTNPRLWWFGALAALIYGIWGRLWDQGIDRSKIKSPPIIAILAALLLGALIYSQVSTVPPEPVAQIEEAAEPEPATGQGAFLEVAIPLVAKWEGLRTSAYLDLVGIPTVCYGETQGVQMGDSYSEAECNAMLGRRILEYRSGLHRYFTAETKAHRLPPERDAAYSSFAYNVGVAGAGKSTATRRLNAGDIAGGCEALTWWNKAGNRVLRGLVRRRAEERRYCLMGLTA